ncbi:MAG: hypothetical protein JWO03_84 [Bacteroidetes bacterium]|nr:hypothetical protein [Bacteroidota bacterium]
MKDTTKVLLGVLAGAAAGVAVGIAISDSEAAQDIKDAMSEAGEQLNLRVQNLIEDSRDYLGDLKEKLATNSGLAEGIENTEG